MLEPALALHAAQVRWCHLALRCPNHTAAPQSESAIHWQRTLPAAGQLLLRDTR